VDENHTAQEIKNARTKVEKEMTNDKSRTWSEKEWMEQSKRKAGRGKYVGRYFKKPLFKKM
jgi:hypothetical protein